MSTAALTRRFLPKPWGRRVLPSAFGAATCDGPLGEVWFESGSGGDELLVKYLFTSERLSIQVHPDDEAARALGLPSGKDEAWIVLDAVPGAKIGIGLKRPVSRQELREAAQSGQIEELVDWRPASAGDVYNSSAGTIHALGQGLTLVEIQQNVDVTFRLYDYGRPRELHLDAAVAAANPFPFIDGRQPLSLNPHRHILAQGSKFVVERWTGGKQRLDIDGGGPVWLVPIGGRAKADGEALEPGQVYVARNRTRLHVEGELLIAYGGPAVRFASAWASKKAA